MRLFTKVWIGCRVIWVKPQGELFLPLDPKGKEEGATNRNLEGEGL